MKTMYVDMSVSHQNELRAIFNLVKFAAPFERDLAPVSHFFLPGKDLGIRDKEVILNNRFTLNPHLVSFTVSNLADCHYETMYDLFTHGRTMWTGHQNPQVAARNYETGVHELFELLKSSMIFIWKPEEKLTPVFHAYKWFDFSKAFLPLAKMYSDGDRQWKYEQGEAWKSEDLVKALTTH